MPASRPSFPGESRQRRLGVGSGPGGGERLLRAQLLIALVLGFTALAVLLYLWRKPSGPENAPSEAARASASAPPPSPSIVRTKVEPAKPPPAAVVLGAVQKVKCGASPRHTGGEAMLCDSLPFFERELARAIEATVECAPKEPEEGNINYVLAIDFRTKDLRVYPGQSGKWRGKQAKKAAACVQKAIAAPAWDTISHQYRWYAVALLATYPPRNTTAYPSFE